MNNLPKVLIVARFHPVLTQELEKMGYQCVFKEALPYEVALEEISEYEGLITSNHLPVDIPMLDKATKLKWVGRLGSGMEIIEVSYAKKKGIACFSSPEGNANAVAEQALGMLLALRHHIFKSYSELKNGQWLREENRGHELENKTAGIIGLGNNGSAFAKKLLAMGMKVLAYDKFRNNYGMAGVQGCENLNKIFEKADVLSFHVPLNFETKYYFDQKMLASMRRPFILLNLSRGSVVEQDTVYEGLTSGKITGAALDVWEDEPFWKRPNSELAQKARNLLQLPNFIGTPHIGGYTFDALYKMSKTLAEKVSMLHK